MTVLTNKLLQKFLKLAGKKLKGDWIIMGGTVLPLLGVNYRVTVDIDLVAIGGDSNSQNLSLMSIADELGLPVETINQAGEYFLSKIKDVDSNLIELYCGESARMFRPNLYLYLKLKISRLTETDCTDCLKYIAYCKKNDPDIDAKKIMKLLITNLKRQSVENKKILLQKIINKMEY